MTSDLWHFTRGSELMRHRIALFGKSVSGLLIVFALALAGGVYWEASATLTQHDLTLVLLRLRAEAWMWLELDPAKETVLPDPGGYAIRLAVSQVSGHPLVVVAWGRMLAAITTGMTLGGLIGAPLVTGLWWWFRHFGQSTPAEHHDRGATLVSGRELEDQLTRFNARKRAESYRQIIGWLWWWKTLLTDLKTRDRAGLYRPYALAGYPFPWGQEVAHGMIFGTTGTGKTTVLRDLLYQARERGHRAVVFDLTGAYIEAFYDAERDILLNPLDVRCPYWTIFHECRTREDFTAAAEALLPHDGGTSEPFWILAARLLFVEACLRLQLLGRTSNEDLARELMTTSLAQVHKLLRNTMADPLTAPEAARMAESIRAVFNVNAQALLSLPQSGDAFSIRRWIEDERHAGSILFISARYADLAMVRSLLTLWTDTAIHTLTSLPINRALRLWFLFDELGALHRLPAIEKGLQTSRNFGGAFLIGIHAIAKLKETYGERLATTLASLARTKLILATSDYETAKWCSEFLGHRQFRKMEEGYSYGASSVRDAVTLTPQTKVEPLVMPDDIMNLPNLYGYIKFPGGFPAAPVKLHYRTYATRADAFVRRPSAGTIKPLQQEFNLTLPPPEDEAEGGGRPPSSPAAETAQNGSQSASQQSRRGRKAAQNAESEATKRARTEADFGQTPLGQIQPAAPKIDLAKEEAKTPLPDPKDPTMDLDDWASF